MKITILCVGKVKEKYLNMGIEEYSKRLGRYCNLQIVEVSDEKTPDSGNVAEISQIKKKEGERLLKYIKEGAYVIALAIEGKELTSVEFSDEIEKLGISSESHIMFIIGGSLGLDEAVLKRADYKLSFSKMTFPHQMMRMILLEQIYRAYRIMHNQPYHK